jgi:WD40 repeat protein
VYAQFYNGSQQEFGKNRVQYFEFDWRFQNYERFKIYFYRGSDDYAEYVSKTLQKEILDLEERLDFKIQDHLEVLLFKSLSELRQSNVGLTNENQAIYGGKSQIVGSKLLLYYDNDHIALNQQIKTIIAETILRKLLYGSQWSDVLIGNDINKHPIWFTGGFVDYLAKDWDATFESKIKDGFLTGKYDNFSLLEPEDARLAGHAFWHYVQETFGKSQLMSLLFVTKNVGHIDRSMLYLLGSNLNDMLPEFSNYYKKRFLSDVQWQEEIVGAELDIRMKKTDKLTHFTVDKSGNNLAYVLNREGRYKLYVQENQKRRKKIAVYEPKLMRIQDESFPTMSFHPNGKYIAYFIERKGKLFFCLYDYAEKSTLKKEVPSLEKIVSCDYSTDGRSIAISGVKNGQTDLYIYSIPGNSLDQLTDDVWDDLNPKWTIDGQSILFSSNRTENEPPKKLEISNLTNTYDLYLFPLKDKDKKRLTFERITETPGVNERQVIPLNNGNLAYLSDVNGMWNRWELKKDSTIAFIDTLIHYRPDNKTFPTSNLTSGILQHQIVSSSNTVYSLLYQNNRYRLIKSELEHKPKESNISYFKDRFSPLMEELPAEVEEKREEKLEEKEPILDTTSTEIQIFKDGKYEKQKLVLYQNEKEYQKEELIVVDPLQFEKDTPKKYKLNFAKDYASAKIDNAFLSESYQVYAGPGSVFLNPKISGMLNISFSDAMEDIVIAGGLRIPSARNNSEFFTGINFRKKRLDKQIFYYRRTYETNIAGINDKTITHEAQLNLVYPFSEVLSLRGTVLSRTDILHPIALNEQNLLRKINYNYQAGLKTSLVFDNAKQWSENCWSGSRMKVFAEYLQGVESNTFGMVNLGFDARHSVSLRKELIWVNRLAAGTSLGGSRLLYYMGGIDNWLLRPTPDFNKDVPVDPKGKFAYQTLATPMRGFVQNQRNGNSFFVFNSELRIPLFHLFTKGVVKNEPLRSFQLVTFFDLGTAWIGASPFSKQNTFNDLVIDNKPVVITIENSIEPIIAATGFGMRTKIFGYFVRADIGWGIENLTFQKKAMFFLSFNHDI